MSDYKEYLATWPGLCHVADAPGGRITAYVFGGVVGKNQYYTGTLATVALASMDLIDFGIKLSKLQEDYCEKIYDAYSMQMIFPANNHRARDILSKLGYQMYKQHQEKYEMRKVLPRLTQMLEILARE